MAKAVKKSTTTFSSLISRRVAKRFSDRQVYFGSITGYDKTHKLWSIQYDDGDYEEMDWKDINEAFKLYEMLMLDFHGEDEITINYEETEALFEERKVGD